MTFWIKDDGLTDDDRNNGNTIPAVGLGTWQSAESGDVVYNAVKTALANGYRHIDTAMAVSKAIKNK
jgi:glycerol 2-dehydrogenase (NADP+)